ncbi:MAG: DUF362 domain-containing protein [Anaerolineae bacterium]|nr:DUF362 domain-containing protein [Anaerolineae bacterium]
MNRRTFLKASAIVSGAALLPSWPQFNSLAVPLQATTTPVPNTQVAFVKTQDRVAGVKKALELLGFAGVKGKNLFLKPNFNSADPTPGSTHSDTLRTLVQTLQTLGAEQITIGDRSGMGQTRAVMEQLGIFRLAEEIGFKTVVFDELTANDWVLQQLPGSHWQQGFALPRPVLEADGIIQTCCLKTHRYGGHFTLSLKNSVGLAAKRLPGEDYNFMNELHSSADQRRMIAEINTAYQPDLVVLDGVEAFVDGGPAQGKKVQANVILAGTDRVAIDAVGVAILRYFGTTETVSQGAIFEQEQIARAVELGIGVDSPAKIELVTGDPASATYAKQIQEILRQ